MFMRLICSIFFAAFTSSLVSAQVIHPGQLVTPFGDGDGIKRIDFNDLTGAAFDSARAVVLITNNFGVTQKILIAGIAGGNRVGIVQLNANGSGDNAFGNNGRALSTRTNVKDFAGMVRMPNGDIVIGYADEYLGPNDGKDFFIEVFSANGQPKNIGGPEVFNQQYVDLSTDQSTGSNDCNLAWRENTARSLIATTEGNVLVVGEQMSYFANGDAFSLFHAFAEFNSSSYAPARAAWGQESQCRSAGGGAALTTSGITDAVSAGGNSIHVSGSGRLVAGGERVGIQQNILLGQGGGIYSSYMPSGFWSNAESAFHRIRLDPNNASTLLLYGDRESGSFGDGQLLRPLVGRSTGNTLTPLFFRAGGNAQSATVSIRDGNGIYGSDQFWVVGGAAECSVANNCARNWNSIVVGVSTGAALFDTYLPDQNFAGSGWLRLNIPNYSGDPTTNSFAWKGALQQPSSSFVPTELFVVGEFAFDAASNDYDWFVAKIRVTDSTLAPISLLFRDSFE